MAHAVVDEAFRNVVAVGADPDRVALLDNFSWGDPRRPTTLGGLVAAVVGCHDAAVAYGAPFVSGKDSLNNEYTGADGQRHAVPPTLVITAVAHVPDVGQCVTAELAAPGDVLVLVGHTAPEFAGSHLDLVLGAPADVGAAPQPDPDAPARYRRLHTAIRAELVQGCHDVSEGGLAVALAELCIAGRLGAMIDALPHDDLPTALFAESNGRLVVEVRPDDLAPFLDIAGPATVLGTVTADPTLRLPGVDPVAVDTLAAAFLGGDA
jgi:phosphoribosylformylglycinamidine synthase